MSTAQYRADHGQVRAEPGGGAVRYRIVKKYQVSTGSYTTVQYGTGLS